MTLLATVETDQTAALQAALDAGEVIPAGAYRMDGTLRLAPGVAQSQQVDLYRLGPPVSDGSRKWSPRNAGHVKLADGATVVGWEVFGTNEAGVFDQAVEAQHAFNLSGTTGARLIDCWAHNVWGDWVYVGQQGGTSTLGGWTEHWSVQGGGALNVGRQGIGIAASRYGQVGGGFVIDGTGRSGIDVEPFNRTVGCTSLDVGNGTIRRVGGRVGGCGNSRGDVGDITFHDLFMDGLPFGISFAPDADPATTDGQRRYGIHVERCRSTGTTPHMHFAYVDGLWITDNDVVWQRKRATGIKQLDTCTDRHIHQSAPAGLPTYDIED